MTIPSPDQLATFSSLSPPSIERERPHNDTYLLATIKSNLTITKPTLILTDSSNQDFALVFDPPFTVSEPSNPNAVAEKFKQLGLKKGSTVIIRNAKKTRKEREAGQGFVVLGSLGRLAVAEEAGAGTGADGKRDGDGEGGELLGVVPGPLQMTKWMLEILRQRDESSSAPEEREEKMCDGKFDGCTTPKGKEGDQRGLKRCQGCVEVWYCSKECQTKRWTAHKDECKTIKALRKIWPRPEGME
ncbi:hypothetical protein QBC32DRAFT_374909 [Pseudoneurospora amorphoporcata]|uniref:MYND-type domain-containing protein n=1 Tax=Pseudoneurospora amorphoporcata TaxID=241081 RepID=A0AAN6P5U4_9PEZI|nr:hypothetical protein QBC32DRAFT_374909 [Pseudoneurospora amorphoporcata]